jgi:hypothetical protein
MLVAKGITVCLTLHQLTIVAYKQTSGDSGANVKRLDVETKEKIAQLQKDAQTKAPDVSFLLLARMCMRETLKIASFICGS